MTASGSPRAYPTPRSSPDFANSVGPFAMSASVAIMLARRVCQTGFGPHFLLTEGQATWIQHAFSLAPTVPIAPQPPQVLIAAP